MVYRSTTSLARSERGLPRRVRFYVCAYIFARVARLGSAMGSQRKGGLKGNSCNPINLVVRSFVRQSVSQSVNRCWVAEPLARTPTKPEDHESRIKTHATMEQGLPASKTRQSRLLSYPRASRIVFTALGDSLDHPWIVFSIARSRYVRDPARIATTPKGFLAAATRPSLALRPLNYLFIDRRCKWNPLGSFSCIHLRWIFMKLDKISTFTTGVKNKNASIILGTWHFLPE